MGDYDARFVLADRISMGTVGAVSQSTIVSKEPSRLKEVVLTGTLNASASTRIFLKGANKVEMVTFTGIIENSAGSTDNWVGYDYSAAAFTTHTFALHWDGPDHSTSGSRNSFVFDNVHADLQGKKYRIWCKFLENI